MTDRTSPETETVPVAYQFRQRSAVGKGPQSSLPWCDWVCIEREDYERYVREPNNLVQVRPLYACKPGSPGLRSPLQAPDGFRVVPVRVLQSAYDRVDAMLANIEPDLRAANSVRIELRHLINETYAIPAYAKSGYAPTPGLWRPIETAPKDKVIMLCVEGWQPCSGRWWPVDSCWTSFDWEGHFETDAEITAYCNGTSYEPTHWMPLPQGPNTSTDRTLGET